MNPEVWKPIKGFQFYQVSDRGRVRSIDRYYRYKRRLIKGKLLALYWDGRYQIVCLYDRYEKKKHTKGIHRLVAEAFLKRHHSHTQVNHKDGDRRHNWVDNLEWCTVKQNVRHAHRTRTIPTVHGEAQHMAKLTDAIVKTARREYQRGVTIASLARKYNVSTATMSEAVRMLSWRHV